MATSYNTASDMLITGSSDADSVHNSSLATNVTINLGDGKITLRDIVSLESINIKGDGFMATKYNEKDGVIVSGTSSADSITNSGYDVTISSGDGNDTIINHLNEGVSINAGAGNDFIETDGFAAEINAGAGNDTIRNYGDYAKIDAGAGNDSITNSGWDVTINAGTGNNYVVCNEGEMTYVYSGGNDTLVDFWNTEIDFGSVSVNSSVSSGNTVVYNLSNGNTFTLVREGEDEEDEEIINEEDDVLVEGTDYDDTISNEGSNVTIEAGNGDDSIVNNGSNVTIDTGADDDDIENNGNNVIINAGGGNDYIYTEYTGRNVTALGGDGDDTIENSADYARLSGDAGNDSIVNTGGDISINAGDGNDFIYNDGYDDVTIDAGDGADTVNNDGSEVTIDGGAGNDLVTNTAAQNVTIKTAQGNDTIKLGSAVKSFRVENFGAGDVISLATAATGLETVSGGIKAGNVTIGGITKVATVNNAWQTSADNITYQSATVAGAKVSGKKITYDTSSGKSDLFTIDGLSSSVGVSLADMEVTLTDTALVNRTSDIITISDGYMLKLDSGVDTTKENLSVWTTLSGGNTVTYNESVAGANKVTFSGVKGTPTLGSGTVSLTANNFNGNASVVSNAGNYKFALSGNFNGKKFMGTAQADTITNSGSKISISTGAGNDSVITDSNAVSISGGAGNDSIVNDGNTVTITGGTGDDVIENDGGKNVLFTYKDGDGNDTITGFNSTSKLQIGNGTTDTYFSKVSGNDVIITVGDGSITLNGAATLNGLADSVKHDNILGTWNTLALLKVDTNSPISLAVNEEIVTVDATARTNKTLNITLNANDNTFLGGSKNDIVYAGTGDDSILGNAGNDSLFGEAGNDTLSGGTGNDILTGGAGNDVFVYQKGKDVITDYDEDEDVIKLASATLADIVTVTNSAGNTRISLASNSYVSILGGQYKEITIIDAVGNELQTVVGGKKITDNSPSGSTYTFNETLEAANGKERSKAIQITSNALDNVIRGGSGRNTILGGDGDDYIKGGTNNDSLLGEAGNDTLSGGSGNDKLTGGEGEDTFVFTAGSDVITDYESGKDKIVINAEWTAKNSGNKVVFTTADGTLTVNNAKYKMLTINGNDTIVGGQFITNADDSIVAIGSDIGYVDATTRTKAIEITGNSLENTILGGTGKDTLYGETGDDSLVGGKGNDMLYGGDGDDTLWGGKGNDSLRGNGGANTFIYNNGDGKDVIYGFDNSDILQITTETFSGYCDKDDDGIYVSIKVGSTANAITLRNNSTTTFRINGDVYTHNGAGTDLYRK